MKDALDLVWIILVLALVFYLTWLVTRFVAVKARGNSTGKLMRVVDRLNIANDKCILLVKVGEEYCVIGVTGHEMRLLKTLAAEEADSVAQQDHRQPTAWPEGSPAAGLFRGMQSFSERLGFAMRRPGSPDRKGSVPYGEPKDGLRDESDGGRDDQSVIDMMNERIKLRKETKRH